MSKNESKRVRIPTVGLMPQLYERAKETAARKGSTLQEYVNDVILMTIEKDALMARLAPNLSLVGKSPTSLLIRDEKQNRTAEIVLHDSRLECYLCEKNDCPHIEYAKMLPELGHLNIRRQPPQQKGGSVAA